MKWTCNTSMNSIEDRSKCKRDHCRQVDSPGLGRVAIWVAPVLLTIRQSRYFYYFNLLFHQTNSHHASESSIDHANVVRVSLKPLFVLDVMFLSLYFPFHVSYLKYDVFIMFMIIDWCLIVLVYIIFFFICVLYEYTKEKILSKLFLSLLNTLYQLYFCFLSFYIF